MPCHLHLGCNYFLTSNFLYGFNPLDSRALSLAKCKSVCLQPVHPASRLTIAFLPFMRRSLRLMRWAKQTPISVLQAPSQALKTPQEAQAGAQAIRTSFMGTLLGVTTVSPAPRALGAPPLSLPAASPAPSLATGYARCPSLLSCHAFQDQSFYPACRLGYGFTDAYQPYIDGFVANCLQS